MIEPLRRAVLPNGLPLTHFRLENGLELYVIENHSAPIFNVQTWFNVGSRDESLDHRLGRTGLAHLFEHMMFRGTASHPDGEFDDILARSGARDGNATTWLDRTNYYQSLPSSGLDLVLGLEADRMVNLQVDQALMETEKGAVLGEYRMGLDDPTTMAYEHLYAQAFTVHPYRYTTIGTEAEIEGFTVEDANYFYRTYYAPNNAVIFLTGDIDPRQALDRVQAHYGRFPPQTIRRIRAPTEPEQASPRRFEFEHAQLTEPKLLIGHHTPAARHADQAALWVLDSLLTTGQGARLQEAWIDSGLAVSVDGSLDQFLDPGLHILSADLQLGRDPGEAVAILDRVLEGLDSMDPPRLASEVERARNQLLLMVQRCWSDNDALASFLGEYVSAAGDPLFALEQVLEIERVRPEDVLRVAAHYLRPSNRTIVVGRPTE